MWIGMSNVNNLTAKIIEDANSMAKEIVEEAKLKEKSLIARKVMEAEKEKTTILSKAKIEGKTREERIISSAKLKVRNMKLQAKGEMLDMVFEKALDKLSKISKEEHLNFIKNSILAMDIDGDEDLIIGINNDAVTPEFMNELNQALTLAGKKGELKLSSYKKDIKGGYVIAKNGIEINNSFEALVMSFRDELEIEVMGILFS